jgi:diaminohydroxyphosphoribosylaminopyrimidine deaminase/5-amino-6-(5-phosphoribosylamino)uracil reductase
MLERQRDEEMMRRCLALAQMAAGRTSPNPLVGSVVLDSEGMLVGEGYHPKAGLAHAEVFALDAAAERALGGTLYVNLEPCSHFGRTPPCANRVIASGVKRVVIGMQDPNPAVCGAGIQRLQQAGITVDLSTLNKECYDLNRAFVKRITTGLPWLALKMACTLDGRIADRQGKSRWISGAEARAFVHGLRNIHDCVLIGAATALADDPELNVREIDAGRDPHRAVADPSLRISPSARLCQRASDSSSWTAIFTGESQLKNAAQFPEHVKLIEANNSNGRTDFEKALRWLAENEVQSVLCEGGGRLAAALLEASLVDEIYWIVAPKLFVDGSARSVLGGEKSVSISECLQLEDISYKQLGFDMLIQGKIRKP